MSCSHTINLVCNYDSFDSYGMWSLCLMHHERTYKNFRHDVTHFVMLFFIGWKFQTHKSFEQDI